MCQLGMQVNGDSPLGAPYSWGLDYLGDVPGPTGLTGGHKRGSLITGPCMNFLCNPVRLKFSNEGKSFPGWEAGQSWGLWLYQSGYNSGLLFTVRLKVGPIQIGPTRGIEPNSVLVPREATHAPIQPAHPLPEHPPKRLPGPTLLIQATHLQLAIWDLALKTSKTHYLI